MTGVIKVNQRGEIKFKCLFKTAHVLSQHASDEYV